MSSALWLSMLLAAAAGPATASPAAAEAPSEDAPLRGEVLLSPTFGMEVGIRGISSLRQLVFLYDGALSTRLGFDDSTFSRRIIGAFARTAKLLLVDAPITQFLDIVEHEVFGHGARAREGGLEATFVFALPFPYHYLLAPKQDFGGYASYLESGIPDRDLPMTAGGIEADLFSAHFVALRTFRAGGRIHFSESLHYLDGKLTYVERWSGSQTLGDRTDGSDLDSYARLLQRRFNRYGRTSEIELSQRLRRAYLASFLDPLWWISLYDVTLEYLRKGQRHCVVPQLKLGGLKLFPLTRFVLSPFGGEHYLDLMISSDRFTLDLSVRGVSSGLATSWGLGGRLFRWELHPAVELGASLDLWLQPELLPEYRNAFDGRTLAGASAMLEATWRPLENFGLVAQLGGKSRGYVMSQPVAEGLFGFAGIAYFAGR